MEGIRKLTAMGMALLIFAGAFLVNGVPVGAAESSGDVAISPACFPDRYFREFVSGEIDENGDGVLSEKERMSVNTLKVQGMSITSLKGIEYFGNLRNLSCEENQLFSLDVSSNKALQNLDCSYNQLAVLDVSANGNLATLYCGYNRLAELDVTQNPLLDTLRCEYNRLLKIDTGRNPLLRGLICEGNQLSALDLRSNTGLEALSCSRNRLTSLDLTPSTASDIVLTAEDNSYCIDGLLTGRFDLDELAVLGFDPDKASSWEGGAVLGKWLTNFASDHVTYTYDCGKGKKVRFSLALGAYIKEDNFPDPVFRKCLAEFDMDGDGALSQAEISRVKTLDISGKGVTDLTGINLLRELVELDCSNNQLKTLILSDNPLLEKLDCSSDGLTFLDVTGIPALKKLDCSNNRLASLNLSENDELSNLDCSDNQLTRLNLDENKALSSLDCSNNQLTGLNLDENKELSSLDCSNNQLTRLNLDACVKLNILKCKENYLVALKLDNCEELKQENVDASGNVRFLGELPATRQYKLSGLEADGFLVQRASGWEGAIEADGCLKEFTSEQISYIYDCGNDIGLSFRLSVTNVPRPHVHKYTAKIVAATCTEKGYTEYHCEECGDSYRGDYTQPLGHSPVTKKIPGGWKKDGLVQTVCERCGEFVSSGVIKGIASVELKKYDFVYDGVKKKPPVVARTEDGEKISSAFYKVVYSNNVNVGSGKAVVRFSGDYTGVRTLYFKINPMRTKIIKAKGYSKKIWINWEMRKAQVTGYQIQYTVRKDFKSAKSVREAYTVKKRFLNKLEKGKTYYIRIRSYKTVGGKDYYSAWSSVKKATTK